MARSPKSRSGSRHAQWQRNFEGKASLGLAWRGLLRETLAHPSRTPVVERAGLVVLGCHAVKPPVIGLRQGNRGERLFFSVEVACAA